MIYRELSPYFIWKEQDSRDMGIYISELPAISRPKVRSSQHTLVGKAGTLTTLEGEDIYDSYAKQVKIVTDRAHIDQLIDWLRGDSEVVFSNEKNRRYFGQVLEAVNFKNNGGSEYYECDVSFFVEPLKGLYPEEELIPIKNTSLTSALGYAVLGTMILGVNRYGYFIEVTHVNTTTADSHSWIKLHNPGNVKSFPILAADLAGTVSFGVYEDPHGVVSPAELDAAELTFSVVNPTSGTTYYIDSENRLMYSINPQKSYWGNKTSGQYLKLPVGDFYLIWSNSAKINRLNLIPRWRWV